jgi:hypothetical protein
MANRAYLRVWTRDFSETTLIPQLARFLATVPHSGSNGAFAGLTVQPIDVTQSPVAEWDLRDQGYGAPEVAALAAQHLHSDTAYLVTAEWDLWRLDMDTLRWHQLPEPLLLNCYGLEYEQGISTSEGNFGADLGLEHFFTGHAGLLATGKLSGPAEAIDHPLEQTFRRWMASGGNLKEYHAKTRENIQQLFNWMEAIERALPVERSELWSEGEENFEARLDAILAQP